MDDYSCWCYLCCQRVTPVVESDGGIVCLYCQEHFLEQADVGSSSSGDHLPLSSTSLLALVGRVFTSVDDEVGRHAHRGTSLLGSIDFSFGGDRESGARNDVADFALTLAEYLLEGEKRVKRDCPRRLKLNRTRVMESCAQCCICLEDFKLGEEAEETSCKHQFHGRCIGSWLKKGNGTCPMCRFQISDAREDETERLAFAYGRQRHGLGYGGRRVRSSIQGIRNYLRRWAPM